jgi:hypothetical protein
MVKMGRPPAYHKAGSAIFLSGHFGKHRSGSYGDWLKGVVEIPPKQLFNPVDCMLGDADQNLAKINFSAHSV